MTTSDEISRKKERLFAALAAVTTSIILATLFAVTQVHKIRADQNAKAEKVIATLDKAIDEGKQTLEGLNHLGYTECGNPNLIAMRRKLFMSQYIKDIGFYIEEKLCCTTGLGVLPKPFDGASPDYTTRNGYQVWVNAKLKLFDLQYSTIILRNEKYNVAFAPHLIDASTLQPFYWQIVLNTGRTMLHTLGNKNIYKKNKQPVSLLAGISDHYFEKSSSKYPYSIALNLDSNTLAHGYFFNLILLAISSLSIGVIIYFAIDHLLLRYHSIDVRVKKGFKNRSFYCLYQPIVDLKTMKIIGCEALARFRDKQGALYPEQFIPGIKKHGLTWSFTEQLISDSLKELEASGLPDKFKVSYNIFPHDVLSNDIAHLPSLCQRYQQHLNIVFEIIEDEYLDAKTSQQNLANLYQAGFQIAIDDFGTGYSNLNQLKKIQCQFLKVDRTFVIDMEEGSIKSSLIKHIVDIAHGANLDVIAEGIENVMQLQALTELGVEFGQGWAFGKPMAVEKLFDELTKQY